MRRRRRGRSRPCLDPTAIEHRSRRRASAPTTAAPVSRSHSHRASIATKKRCPSKSSLTGSRSHRYRASIATRRADCQRSRAVTTQIASGSFYGPPFQRLSDALFASEILPFRYCLGFWVCERSRPSPRRPAARAIAPTGCRPRHRPGPIRDRRSTLYLLRLPLFDLRFDRRRDIRASSSRTVPAPRPVPDSWRPVRYIRTIR